MSKIKDIVFYIPFGVNPSKVVCVRIGIWMAISIVFFCFVLTELTGSAREIYFFYFGGIIPMMIAFQDKNFVEEHIKKEFKSLMLALYRQNIIFFMFFLLVSFFETGNFETDFMRMSVAALYWCSSIPLSVIYDNRKWYMYAIAVLLLNGLFLFCQKQVQLNYIISFACVIFAIIGTVIFSRKQIRTIFN